MPAFYLLTIIIICFCFIVFAPTAIKAIRCVIEEITKDWKEIFKEN